MANFIEMPHGIAFDVEQVLWYQLRRGDSYDPDKDGDDRRYYERSDGKNVTPTKLLIYFKNGDDLEIPDFEQYFVKRLWDALDELELKQSLPTPPVFDATSNSGVYFIQGEITRRIKIGFSDQVDKRIKALETSEPLRLLHVMPNVSTDMERDLHKKFAHLRVIGEWFDGEQELIGYIKSLPPHPEGA